jgi:hypothetical protein
MLTALTLMAQMLVCVNQGILEMEVHAQVIMYGKICNSTTEINNLI